MALAFDTLAFANSLEDAGMSRDLAETHARAIRDHVMKDLVTRSDLTEALDKQTLRLTIRLGAMVATATGLVLAAFALFP